MDHLEDPGVDGSILLCLIFMKWDGGGGRDWIDLTQNRNRWLALENVVMNLWVTSIKYRKFFD
jgi:hypothetical protein